MREFTTLSSKVVLVESSLRIPWVMVVQVKRVYVESLPGNVEVRWHVI